MGNVLRSLYGYCCKPTTTGDSDSLGPTALAHDLWNFEITFQVPEGLSRRVQSSRNDQANWYRELLEAWKEARPQPETPEEAASLVIQTLERHQQADVEDLEGLLAFYGLPYSDVLQRLLAFYGLPLPHTLIHLSDEIPTSLPEYLDFQSGPGGIPTSLPEGVQFVLHTLPVPANAVGDGDGMIVYVNIADPRESKSIPREVLLDALERLRARARKDYTIADELRQNIIDSGYRVIKIQNEEVLARKHRIRLRGIDAPEMEMPYGNEAREELANLVQGKCLRVLVYEEDRYGRLIGDVYCNGIFVQEALLKRGCAWYSKVHDKRQEFATWEKEARGKRVGLWADANPEKPWEWKKRNNPREG